MPSLRALEEFKTSLQLLGNELQVSRELELPPDELLLPEHEPAVIADETPADDASADTAAVFDSAFSDTDTPDFLTEPISGGDFPAGIDSGPADTIDTIDTTDDDGLGADIFGDLSDLLGGMTDTVPDASEDIPGGLDSGQADTDFGSFIDSIPDDFTQAEDADSAVPAPDEDDFGLPPGLLDGLSDEIEAERNTAAEEARGDNADYDFGDLTELDPEEPAAEPDSDTGGDELDLASLPDFGSGDSAAADDFGDGDLPDFGGESGASDLGDSDGGGFDTSSAGELDSDTGAGELDLASLPDFGSGDSAAADDFGDGDLPDFSSEPGTGDFGNGDLPDFDSAGDFELPDEDFAEPANGAELGGGNIDGDNFDDAELDTAGEYSTDGTDLGDADFDGADFDDVNIGESLELPGEEASPLAASGAGEQEDFSADDDNFDYTGNIQDLDAEAVLEEIPGDSFDNFSPDSGLLGGNFEIGDNDDFDNMDELSLPGLDGAFGEPSPSGSAPEAAQGTAGIPGADEVEEINLSTEELEQLLTTLSLYPLNLRVACEELIAEQAVAPDQMSRLIQMLIDGAAAKETAALAGKILDRTISIPKGFEKKTGEELEAEQASFAYIFVHNFLPVLRLFLMISLVLLSAGYLSWRYIYTPIRAERIYKLGIERIDAGEYGRANERFVEAYRIHQKKEWFYTYARAFRDARQYTLAEEKYQELLHYTASKDKRYIPEKAAVLEYADLETNYIGDYEAADTIIRRNILDYYPTDRDALLALGDNNLAWGEFERERLEDAREAYAMIMERYGRTDPLLERMLKYFIRTDNLGEVLTLHGHFMSSDKTAISAAALAEMGGYFLDKRLEEVRGVPNEYLENIGGIREILLRAIQQDSMLPESYYHLARYYNYFENANDERATLELAVQVFDAVREESPKRIGYHINTLRRYAEILMNSREFFPAEENLVKGVNLYEDALSRRLLQPSPEFGRVYADLGDLEYFVKDGDMRSALDYYRRGEESGWAPPEIKYRMGGAHYQLREWGPALDRFFEAHRDTPFNRRVLYALGNVSYMRGNYFAAQGYYDRLLEMLDDDRSRLPPIAPTDDGTQLDLAERLMIAQNNFGVTLEALTERTGNSAYRARAQGLYSDSERAWDVLTRNPDTMLRMQPSPDINAPGINPAYLNVQNSLHPVPGYEAQFFLRIDKDMLEPSIWEDLVPPGYRLSEGIHTGR